MPNLKQVQSSAARASARKTALNKKQKANAKRMQQILNYKIKSKVIKAPVAQTRQTMTGAPKFNQILNKSDGSTVIRHREYVQDVPGSVAFSNTQLNINPGLQALFFWLAAIAGRYESYLFRSLKFCFETEKSASTSGTVMMAVDYDASDSAPLNKQQIMAYHGAVRSAVWAEDCFQCDLKDLRKFGIQRYIRSGVLAANQDIKTYDVGVFNIATQGCADTTAVGELYVEYELELHTPQLDPNAIALSASLRTSSSVGVTRAAPFGTSTVSTGGLSIVATAATITFNQVGQYMLLLSYVGTVVTDTAPTITGTVTNSLLSGIAAQFHDTAALSGILAYRVQCNNIGETMIFDFTASATTITSYNARFASYAFALN